MEFQTDKRERKHSQQALQLAGPQQGELLGPSIQRPGHEGHLQRDPRQGDVCPRHGHQQTSRPH